MSKAYPLQWPIGRPRWSGPRQTSQFKLTDFRITEHLFNELDRMQASGVVISTNRPSYNRSNAQPEDPGVAVYFTRKGQDLCIACDKYRRVEDNLHAVGFAIESFRSLERHGTGEMVDAAFSGFTALPETIIMGSGQARAWHEILQVSPNADPEVIRAAYKRLVFKHHPDHGGSEAEFAELHKAYEESGAAS